MQWNALAWLAFETHILNIQFPENGYHIHHFSITFQPENSPRFFAWFIPAAVGYAEFQVLNDASMNYNAAAAG